jgi:hypothetical protein
MGEAELPLSSIFSLESVGQEKMETRKKRTTKKKKRKKEGEELGLWVPWRGSVGKR